MITCVVHYTIDPAQLEAFERFARTWMRLVARRGGVHHGYFLPAEGASDRAEALFSFERREAGGQRQPPPGACGPSAAAA
ncbi:NIPSNAP family protein [Micromonospora sp. DT31]|uniref:NIPSNAP family protein n=1 Tax=Micromonospora sp. DT31 TaxID=3393434 RepID=UPI003CEBB965